MEKKDPEAYTIKAQKSGYSGSGLILTTVTQADNKLTTKTRVFAEKCVEIRRTQKHEYEGIRANLKKCEERTLIFPTMKSIKE